MVFAQFATSQHSSGFIPRCRRRPPGPDGPQAPRALRPSPRMIRCPPRSPTQPWRCLQAASDAGMGCPNSQSWGGNIYFPLLNFALLHFFTLTSEKSYSGLCLLPITLKRNVLFLPVLVFQLLHFRISAKCKFLATRRQTGGQH